MKLKNTLKGINSRLNDTNQWVSEVKNRVMKPLNRKRNENRVKGLWDNTNCTNIDIIGSPKEK